MSEQLTTLLVSGMTCGHCESTVKSTLERTPGVHRADVRLDDGVAEVAHDDSVSGPELANAVSQVGFEASVRPPSGGEGAG